MTTRPASTPVAADSAALTRGCRKNPAGDNAPGMESRADYTPLRHAAVELPDAEFVAIGRWDFNSSTEWCVELWDAQGEADRDACFSSEAEAESYAVETYGVSPSDWRPGPNRFDRPGAE